MQDDFEARLRLRRRALRLPMKRITDAAGGKTAAWLMLVETGRIVCSPDMREKIEDLLRRYERHEQFERDQLARGSDGRARRN